MIQLNYRDPRPIYEQVKDGIRKLAYAGVLGPDEKLPSVRELASKLAINPNTISKAYKELEMEGFIYTVTGRGTFINQEFDLNDRRKEELYKTFDKVTKELLEIAISVEELKSRIDALSVGKGTQERGDEDQNDRDVLNKAYEKRENNDDIKTLKGGSTDDSGK